MTRPDRWQTGRWHASQHPTEKRLMAAPEGFEGLGPWAPYAADADGGIYWRRPLRRVVTDTDTDGAPMFDATTRATIDAIVATFETGEPMPTVESYATLVVLDDGAGFTYGRHQLTRHSLSVCVRAYVKDPQTSTANALGLWLPQIEAEDSRSLLIAPKYRETGAPEAWPGWAKSCAALLVHAAEDPMMRRIQEDVFDRLYFEPALGQLEDLGLKTPLSMLSLYDLAIHSGPDRLASLRKRFPEMPPSKWGNEQQWTKAMNIARTAALENNARKVVRQSAVRVDRIMDLCRGHNWALTRPIVIGQPYNRVVE